VFSALYLTSLPVHIRSFALSCLVQDVIQIVVVLNNFTGIEIQREYLRIQNLFLSHNFIHFASFVKNLSSDLFIMTIISVPPVVS
jgi:hypothetical protein